MVLFEHKIICYWRYQTPFYLSRSPKSSSRLTQLITWYLFKGCLAHFSCLHMFIYTTGKINNTRWWLNVPLKHYFVSAWDLTMCEIRYLTFDAWYTYTIMNYLLWYNIFFMLLPISVLNYPSKVDLQRLIIAWVSYYGTWHILVHTEE